MASEQRFVRFLSAFAAATGLLLTLQTQPAVGQILDPEVRREQPLRRGPARTTREETSAEGGERVQDPLYDGRWRPDVRVTAPFASALERRTETPPQLGAWETRTEDVSDPNEPADVLGSEEYRRKRAPRPQDGDLVTIPESLVIPGGAIDLSEPYTLTEEGQAEPTELRAPQETAAFGISSGYDPLLLQADEVNPIFSNRPARQFEPLPFAPLGTRIGSFTLFTNVEADGDYNSNLFASPEALGDTSLEVRPVARLVSNWSTHALELRANGNLSYHDKYPSEDDRAYVTEALGRLDVTRRTNLQGTIAHEEAQESRSAINASSAGSRPDIVVNRGKGSFNHRFNRLTVQLRGGIVDTRYGPAVFSGIVQNNADRDYTLYEEAVRPKWEFKPTLFVFTDVAVNQRDYSIAAFTDGINRTSTGERYRAGVSFGKTGEFLRGEVSLGYGRQRPDSPQLPLIDGLLIDANLAWRPTLLTTLILTAATDVAETTTAGSGGVLERQYAAELRHNFTTRLIGSAAVTYFTRNFVGASLLENQFTAATGLEYYLSRHAVLFGRYVHTAFDTTSPNGNYTAEEVQLGVRLRK